MGRVSIMTFNTRYNTNEDGRYKLHPHRYEYIDQYLKENATDVMGFQEVEDKTQKLLEETLGDRYLIIGMGRLKNFTDESSCIAFRRDKFRLLSCDTFWLSPTPGVHDTCPVDSYPGRVCTTVTLVPVPEKGKDATPFRVYNTHLFHTPDERLRAYGLYVILERMRRDKESADYPVVLMGDFNSTPDSTAMGGYLYL